MMSFFVSFYLQWFAILWPRNIQNPNTQLSPSLMQKPCTVLNILKEFLQYTDLRLDDLEEHVTVGHVELGLGVGEGVRLEVTCGKIAEKI